MNKIYQIQKKGYIFLLSLGLFSFIFSMIFIFLSIVLSLTHKSQSAFVFVPILLFFIGLITLFLASKIIFLNAYKIRFFDEGVELFFMIGKLKIYWNEIKSVQKIFNTRSGFYDEQNKPYWIRLTRKNSRNLFGRRITICAVEDYKELFFELKKHSLNSE